MDHLAEYTYANGCQTCSHAYVLEPVAAALEGIAGPVLDMGCGNGSLALHLIERGFDVYGVDASSSGIRIACSRAPGRFAVGDVSADEISELFPGKSFRAVVSTEVIEHLYDPRAMIDAARRVLQAGGPGGRFVLTTPYHGYLKNLVLAITGRMDAHFTALWDGGHIKFFSRRTLEQMLREQGFRVTGFAGCGRVPYLWKSMLLTSEA